MSKTSHTKLTKKQALFIERAQELGFTTSTLSRADIVTIMSQSPKGSHEFSWPSWITADTSRRLGRGQFNVPEITGTAHKSHSPAAYAASSQARLKSVQVLAAEACRLNYVPEDNVETPNIPVIEAASLQQFNNELGCMVPEKLSTYVAFGHHKDVELILKSGIFAPVFITGLPGNGKTTMVEQVCANLKREYFRVNITSLTDEEDLIGGFRLIAGNMVWADGPVVLAMKRGGVLLLDEIDQGTPKIMCLQAALEGKPLYIKKINTWIVPSPGFTILATANTKGQGDPDGRYAGAQILNGAMLDRLAFTFEQAYPSVTCEKKIVMKNMAQKNCEDEEFAEALTRWADTIRKTFYEGGCDEIVTTRRLIDAVSAFAIFKNRLKSVELVLARFDDSTRKAFLNLYTKLDATVVPSQEPTT